MNKKSLIKIGFGTLFSFSIATFTFAQECPFGVTNDPYPGQCGRYVDQNIDGYCDLGETEIVNGGHQEKVGEHIDNCDVGLASGEISSSEMKAMNVSQIAKTFGLTEEETIKRLNEKTKLNITEGTSMQRIHDQASLPMKEVKTLLSSQIVEEKSESEVLENNISTFQYFNISILSKMYIWIFFARIGLAIVFYVINKLLGKQEKCNKLFCRIDSNIVLLIIPIVSLVWYFRVQSPIMYGAMWGYGALRLLWLMLIARPIMNLLQKSKRKNSLVTQFICRFVCHRKQFGITMFWFAGVHTFLYITGRIKFDIFWKQLLSYSGITGLLSILVTLIGYLTSNLRAMKKLKTYRKPVQRLAYLGLLFAVLHLTFINLERGVVLRFLTVIWGVLRLLARKK